jgi:nucleotide-binding universal stress UspA family protein
MKNSTILIAIGKTANLDDLAKTLESLRDVPARVAISIIGEMPQFPYYALGVPPYGTVDIPIEWQEAVAANNSELKDMADKIEAMLQLHDVSGDVSVIASEPSQVADEVARRAMLCDFAMVSDDLRASDPLFHQVVYGVLFQSPIGVFLNVGAAKFLHAPKRVLIAWNTHLHTARAVHQALPLLRQAKEVIIGTVDPVMTEYGESEDPGVSAAEWLSHHGCTVTVQQYPSGGVDIGSCILARSNEVGADLIVMGSYGHSRTRQAIFGGTTRTLIEQTEQAVFLAH